MTTIVNANLPQTIQLLGQSPGPRISSIDGSKSITILNGEKVVEIVVDRGPRGPQGIPGIQGPPGAGTGGYATFAQGVPDILWTVVHSLGFYPNVTVVDTDTSELEGDLQYIDLNTITIEFAVPVAGIAYLS